MDDPLTPEWRERVERACAEHPINLEPSVRSPRLTERQTGIAKMYNAGSLISEISAAYPSCTAELSNLRAKRVIGRRHRGRSNLDMVKRIMREAESDR